MRLRSIGLGRLGAGAALSLLAWHGGAAAQTTKAAQQMPDQFEHAVMPLAEGPPIMVRLGYSADLNTVTSGGARRGAAFLGKAALIADADLDRMLGLRDAMAHVSIIDIHGTGLSASRVANLAAVSGLEAEPALRLNQAWVEFALEGKARLRIGKFPASQDFMASETAAFFVNATFGWPASFATDLPQGGPSWPLAAPGAMMTLPLSARWSVTAAVFAGTPAGSDADDPQRGDDHGLGAFRFAGKPFAIAEVARTLGDTATVKVGGWTHFGDFEPIGPDAAAAVSPDWAIYGLADWRVAGSARTARQLTLFVRASLSPAEINAVSAYVDLGAELTAPFVGRPRDAVGIAYASARLSPRLGVGGGPHAEHVLELSYRAVLGTHLSLQPNVQFVVDPVDPASLVGRAGVAIVPGVRLTAQF